MTGAPNLEQVLVVTTRASSSAISRRIWTAFLPPKHGVICIGDGSPDHDDVAARNDLRPPSRLGLGRTPSTPPETAAPTLSREAGRGSRRVGPNGSIRTSDRWTTLEPMPVPSSAAMSVGVGDDVFRGDPVASEEQALHGPDERLNGGS